MSSQWNQGSMSSLHCHDHLCALLSRFIVRSSFFRKLCTLYASTNTARLNWYYWSLQGSPVMGAALEVFSYQHPFVLYAKPDTNHINGLSIRPICLCLCVPFDRVSTTPSLSCCSTHLWSLSLYLDERMPLYIDNLRGATLSSLSFPQSLFLCILLWPQCSIQKCI